MKGLLNIYEGEIIGTTMDRIRTGIAELDRNLGGFPAGKTVLVTGDPGTGKTISFPASPIRLRQTPAWLQYPGLPMGGANDYVLQNLLGYPAEEVAKMKEEKVI